MTYRTFFQNREGSVAPMLALAAIPLFGFVGAAVDFSRASSVRAAMQASLDASALMLVKTLQSAPGTPLSSTATAYFNANFARAEAQDVTVTASSSTTTTGLTLALTATSSIKTDFMGLVGFTTLPITVRVNALSNADGLGCVLSLDGSAVDATEGQGNATITLNGCSLYDNSGNAEALRMVGTARLTALSVGVVGGISGTSKITTTGGGIYTGIGAIPDPYAGTSFPAFFSCTQEDFSTNKSITLDPGVYCGGIKIDAHANVTLNPGIYYLDGGSLDVNGQATITGTGVTLVFTKKNRDTFANATINGGATVNLTAPLSGSTAGIVMFGDRDMTLSTKFKLNGGSTQYFGGAIYVSKGFVDFIGGTSTGMSCTKLIADTITFSGNSNFGINCTNYPVKPFSSVIVRLTS